MPRGKKTIYDKGKVVGQKSYYYRKTPDVYGKSKIFLEPIDGTSTEIEVNGQKIWLPTLELEKYYAGAMTYAFIEELEDSPTVMIDVLYASEDIIPRLERDDRFLSNFLSRFSRMNINRETLRAPGILLLPQNPSEQRRFSDAARLAIQESVIGGRFPMVTHHMEEEKEVIDESYDYRNAKEDSIAMEFVKDFYEILSGKKIRRPTEPRKKKVVNSISRKAIIMKIGSTVINNDVVGKYCFAYHTNVENLTEIVTMYMAGVDDRQILSPESQDDERLTALGNTVFESNILETFMYINADRKPINLFAGKYIEGTRKLAVDRKLEKYFDRFNNQLNNSRSSDDGR